MTKRKDDKMNIAARERLDEFDRKVEARWTKQANAKQKQDDAAPGKTDPTHKGGKA